MEQKQLRDLNENPQNPRVINDFDFDNLKASLAEFGDLSGIVHNIRTNQLVGGHQRRQAFVHAGSDQVNIAQRFDQPTPVGTVALGYVILNGEQFSYREVDWPEAKEKAANIAANRIQGDWDLERLAEIDQWLIENDPDMLAKTGQSNDDIQRLLGNEPEAPPPETEDHHLRVKLTASQYAEIDQAIQQVKQFHNVQNPINNDSDGNALHFICQEYLNNLNPGETTSL